MRRRLRVRATTFVPIAALLSACSGEPGAPDIKQALQGNARFMMGLHMLSGMAGGRPQDARKLADEMLIEKGSCATATTGPGYVCDFRTGRTGHPYGPWSKARFFKTNSGWNMEDR